MPPKRAGHCEAIFPTRSAQLRLIRHHGVHYGGEGRQTPDFSHAYVRRRMGAGWLGQEEDLSLNSSGKSPSSSPSTLQENLSSPKFPADSHLHRVRGFPFALIPLSISSRREKIQSPPWGRTKTRGESETSHANFHGPYGGWRPHQL